MASFYIDSATQGILELTSTATIQVDEKATVSKFPLETGDTIVDNVVNDNIVVSFSGVISNIVSIAPPSNQNDSRAKETFLEPVKGYIEALRTIKANKELFTVRYDGKLATLKNCILTSLSLTKDSNTSDGYSVSLSFEQVRIVGRALVATTFSVSSQADSDTTQAETEGGTNNQKENSLVRVDAGVIKAGETFVYKSGAPDETTSQEFISAQ